MPQRVAEYEQNIAQGEGQEAPEDEEMRQPRAVLDGYALEHLALSEDEGQRAEKTAHRLIEAICRLAQQHKPEDALVQKVARHAEGGKRNKVHAHPSGDYSEDAVGGDHRYLLMREINIGEFITHFAHGGAMVSHPARGHSGFIRAQVRDVIPYSLG